MRIMRRRVALLLAFFTALLAVAALRASFLQTVEAGKLRQQASTQQSEELAVSAVRGTITDRHGIDLAVAESATTVVATPYLVKDPARAASRLAAVLGVPEPRLLRKLADRRSGFEYLARRVDRATAIRAKRLHIAGVEFQPEPRRDYPQGQLAAQVLGFVGTENKGLTGLEYSYERDLHGTDGQRTVVRDARGQPVSLVTTQREQGGEDLRLTLDAALQERVEQVLTELGRTYSPKGATAVALDPRTGEVLAMANWPEINANDAGAATDRERANQAVISSFEPGSTFKPFTVAGALENHLVTPSTSFSLAPEIHVADRTIGEAHPRGPVTLTTAQILAQSSNVGAVTIGLELGARRFDHTVRSFGFGRRTGINFAGEAPGIVPARRKYSGSSMGNLPIGQGLAVTPLQLATAYAAIANGGLLVRPRMVLEKGGQRIAGARGRRVIPRTTSAQLRTILKGVLGPDGTAPETAVPGYDIAGKTGTANKPDGAGGYSDTRYVASFVGFAPAAHPRILLSIMVDEPQGETSGGAVAAPAFEQIMEFALPYLRVPPH